VSLLPIVLPVLLIASNTAVQATAPESPLAAWGALLGNPNLAMLFAAAISLIVYYRQRRPTAAQFSATVENALMSGGLIILITAAGGAFGAMLQAAQIGPAIEGLFSEVQASGFILLLLGFFMASLLKFAQGSSTVAMITASAMLASMVTPESLGFNPVYLATAVGSGALVGSWMNDSGFWIFAKMGGLTEVEALKSWTTLLVVLGIAGMLTTLVYALIFPMGG
jgi:GntP family gluconate:H+ symporter